MALAWAQKQEQAGSASSAMAALLCSSAANPAATSTGPAPGTVAETSATTYAPTNAPVAVKAGAAPDAGQGDSASSSSLGRKTLHKDYVVIFTQVLPDGLGDLIFGENAVLELQGTVSDIVWVRCYSGDNSAAGERLIADTAKMCCSNLVCTTRETLAEEIKNGRLDPLWIGARERFLAPWIFGLSPYEEALLRLAQSSRTHFWALTEYGRGMGNIHTYTGGLGCKIETGWGIGGQPGGVFRTIRRVPRTKTNWRQVMADHCQVADPRMVRLWWFYSRGDDEKKHDISFLEEEAGTASLAPHIRHASKVIPVRRDGSIVVAYEKTSGEKLAEQLVESLKDPNFKPNPDVSCAEVSAGTAGQLSQFLWGIVFDPAYTERSPLGAEAVDIIVAPNLLTTWRKESGHRCVAARILHFDLAHASSPRRQRGLDGRTIFVCGLRVPRGEMRSFLEQCEERVFTTGDQSLAEAMFMGKDPCVQPDAKVQQWQLALAARAAPGGVDAVGDLGEELRQLVKDENRHRRARLLSKLRSDEIERNVTAQFGMEPSAWNPTQEVLVRAGMLG